MEIQNEKLKAAVVDMDEDIGKGYAKCEVSIAKIDGVVITLSAYSWREAKDCDIDDPIPEFLCITQAQKGGAA